MAHLPPERELTGNQDVDPLARDARVPRAPVALTGSGFTVWSAALCDHPQLLGQAHVEHREVAPVAGGEGVEAGTLWDVPGGCPLAGRAIGQDQVTGTELERQRLESLCTQIVFAYQEPEAVCFHAFKTLAIFSEPDLVGLGLTRNLLCDRHVTDLHSLPADGWLLRLAATAPASRALRSSLRSGTRVTA